MGVFGDVTNYNLIFFKSYCFTNEFFKRHFARKPEHEHLQEKSYKMLFLLTSLFRIQEYFPS